MAIIGAEEIRFTGGDGIDHVVDRRNQLFDLYQGTIGLKTGLTDARRPLPRRRRHPRRPHDARRAVRRPRHVRHRPARCSTRASPRRSTAEAGLDHLPDVVPDAALDPPERIPGALDVVVSPRPPPSAGGGFDWQSPPVAAGRRRRRARSPALLVRRRLVPASA